MDFLKAEIERKRKQIQEKNVLQPDKKYFKRGDLAAVQEAEYLAKYGPKMEDIKGSKILIQEKGGGQANPIKLRDRYHSLHCLERCRE